MGPDDIILPPYRGHCVKMSVINGGKSHMPAELLVYPTREGQKTIRLACYSFLIESEHYDRKVLFDLAFMKDLDARMPPALKALFSGVNDDAMGVDETYDVPDAIRSQGVELSSINAVILSHSHIDHVGDPSVFPFSTELVVGPGFKAACMPGYPTNPDSFFLDSAFQGRTVSEIDFSVSATNIGGFPAIDFFGDASFWLLSAPGHTTHHMSGLCRTTKDSWVLLGGDACHTVAQLRPSQFNPLPTRIPIVDVGRASSLERISFTTVAQTASSQPGFPFYGLAPGMHSDIKTAEETLEKLRAFDGRDDVLVIMSHDATLLDVLTFFPRDINEWKSKDWASSSRWSFLQDIEGALELA